MATWTTRTTIDASPEDVLAVLTDPEECTRWSPISFDVEQLDCRRLSAGCSATVAGELAGRRVSFDIDVIEAGDGRLRLRASGPVDLNVEYRAEPRTPGVSRRRCGGGRGAAAGRPADRPGRLGLERLGPVRVDLPLVDPVSREPEHDPEVRLDRHSAGSPARHLVHPRDHLVAGVDQLLGRLRPLAEALDPFRKRLGHPVGAMEHGSVGMK